MRAPDAAIPIGCCEFISQDGQAVEPTEVDAPPIECACGWKGILTDVLCVTVGDESPAWCQQCSELLELKFIDCPA